MNDEALRMAIEALQNINKLPTIGQRGLRDYESDALVACKEALEQPTNMVTVPLNKLKDMQRRLKGITKEEILGKVFDAVYAQYPTVAELNDEYLRDTHVEGLSTNSKANEIIKTKKPSYMYVYADGDFFIHSQSPIGAPAHWQYFGKIEVQDD